MAYPEVEAPYGLIPVKMLNNGPFNSAVRQIKIASGYNTNVFSGDAVKLVTGGTVERDTADAAMTPMCVFVGCSYTDADLGFVQRAYWPAGTVASDAVAYVVDDPNVLFKMAVTDGSGAISALAQAAVGSNVAGDEGASANGSTATGRSYGGADATSSATTNTLPFRIVEGVEETKNSSGNYTEVLVKWNAGHQLTNSTGI